MKFDVAGTAPTGTVGSQVARATLRLFVQSASATGTFDVVRVTSAWTEDTIDAGDAPTLGNAIATGVAVTAASDFNFVTVDVTQAVRDWLDGGLANNGLALVPTSAGTSVTFDSKESITTSHPAALDIVLAGGVGGPSQGTSPEYSGGGGGGSGGNGGNGSTIPAGLGAITIPAGGTGATGFVISTQADPAALF